MIISDLTYQESAVEANNLEGGAAIFDITAFLGKSLTVTSGSQSGPEGSTTILKLQDVDVKTFGALGIFV